MTTARRSVARLVLAALAAVALGRAPAIRAQTGGTVLIDERFVGTSVPDPSFTIAGSTCLTGAPPGSPPPAGEAQIPPCPVPGLGPVPTPGVTPGYLQFTDATNNLAGNILYNRPIPASAGVIATFEQWQYGGNGADGISFFLVDGSTQLTRTGGTGGSLGYAQHFQEVGVLGAYVGLGLDAFGNFYNDTENRGFGCTQKPPFPNAFVPGVLTLRGPGDLATGYCYQDSTTVPGTNPPVSTLPGTLRGPTLAASLRRIAITIAPAPTPRVTVTIDFDDGTGPHLVLDVPAPPDPPVTYKFGWAGSTGGQNDIHLLRNVVVETVNPLNRLDLAKQIDRTHPLPPLLVVGDVVPYQFVVTNSGDETLTSLQIDDPRIVNATCPTTAIPPVPQIGSTVVCTGSHVITQADVDAGEFTNTAVASARDAGNMPVTSDPSSVTVVVGSAPKLELDKLVETPPPYAIGQQVTYRYDVTDIGTLPLTNPSVSDDKVAPIVCDTSPILGGHALDSIRFGAATSCSGVSIIEAADIDPTGALTNVAVASAMTTEGQTVMSNQATLTLAVGTDVAVAKSVNQPTPRVGEVVTYVVTATNQGVLDATGLRIADALPAGSELVAATPAPGTTYDATTGEWVIGSLARAASVTLVLAARVTAPNRQTNVATLAALDQYDANPANDHAEATITPVPPVADIELTKTVAPPSARVGQTVTFTVTATNTGPDAAAGVTVTDLLPTGLAFLSAVPASDYAPATGVWTIGSLGVGGSATLVLTARGTAAGTVVNRATLTTSTPPDPDGASAEASVVITPGEARLRITKTANGADSVTVLPDTPVTFLVTVVNDGPDVATGVTVEDTFPSASFVGITAVVSQGALDQSGTPWRWSVGSLDVGASATLTVNATPATP
jgi:uncharacterized repeat protein (TIGR01451 family)